MSGWFLYAGFFCSREKGQCLGNEHCPIKNQFFVGKIDAKVSTRFTIK